MKNIYSLIIILLGITTAFGQFKESKLAPKVLQQLKLNEKQINQNLFAEKILPYDKEKSVLVFPKFVNATQDTYNEDGFDVVPYIVVVEISSGKILQQYQSDELTSDAIQLSSISIDTGLYLLNENTRAFGIRENYSGSSQPNPYGNEVLSLYLPSGKTLKKVLNNFPISFSKGEWDTNCAGEFEDSKSTITIPQKSENKGFRNLMIKIIETNSTSFVVGKDGCEQKSTKKTIKKMLKFNGNEYKF